MSGDSSLGIGIGLALKSYGRGLTYVKTDRALDLGNLEPFTIPDLSGNANTATLYSGIYVSTNGTTDKAIGANATALGSGNYYLSGKIKPAGTTAKTTMNGSTASNLTGLTAGVWQDFQTATASAITPGSINLGWDGTAFNATVDNWSDVKLHDASDDSVVAHWKLYDSADASLNGDPVLDCVGGYHGTHTGCAGGSGEGVDADVAGISATLDDKMWFDGVNDYVSYNTGSTASSHFGSCTMSAYIIFNDLSSTQSIWSHGASSNRIYINSGNIRCNADTTTLFTPSAGILYLIEADFNASGELTEFRVDGNVEYSGSPISVGLTSSQSNFYLGTRASSNNETGIYFNGIIYGFTISGSNGLEWLGNGNTDAAWVDQIGSNDGTVNGSPVTVGQKRETILQTAGEDFNKRMIFDGVNDKVVTAGQNLSSKSFSIKFLYNDLGVSQFVDIQDGANTSRIVTLSMNSTNTANKDLAFGSFTAGARTKTYTVPSGALTPREVYQASWTTDANGDLNGATVADLDGNSITVEDQGVAAYGLGESVATVGDNFASLGLRAFGGFAYTGILYDFVFGSVTYTGYGVNDWGAATVTGGSNYHVAESETTAGQDALGTAITNPRPNERVLNLTTGTGYAEVADSASLDLTTAATWEVWPDFRSTGSERYILSKYDTGGNNRSWAIGVENSVAGSNKLNVSFGDPANGTFEARLDWAITEGVACYHIIYDGSLIGTARCKLYKNGVLVALSASTANPPASLYQNNIPVLVGGIYIAGVISSIFDEQLGDIRIYDRILTADEITKNYNARKGAYGL
jgi:hypothetical protein